MLTNVNKLNFILNIYFTPSISLVISPQTFTVGSYPKLDCFGLKYSPFNGSHKDKEFKQKNKQTNKPAAFCISKKHVWTCFFSSLYNCLLSQAQLECDYCCHLILNKSLHCVLFGDAVWSPLNCEETWKRSQLSTCSTLYSHHCCFGWGGLLLCPVEKCLSPKCHFNLFSGGSESYSFPFRVEHSIWPVLKEKSLKTLLLKASLLAGVLCVCGGEGEKDSCAGNWTDKQKSTEYCQSKTVDVCLKQRGLKWYKNK